MYYICYLIYYNYYLICIISATLYIIAITLYVLYLLPYILYTNEDTSRTLFLYIYTTNKCLLFISIYT